MKTIGVIPVRMASSRFPGKPLHPILGRPMLEHVYLRARMYPHWDRLVVATCDAEIEAFANSKGIPVVMTGKQHTRALDRVAEVADLWSGEVDDDDIVVTVQGDEPMMRPEMIPAVVAPLLADPAKACTVLAMQIAEEEVWRNRDTVKIIHNDAGEVLYTSRAPVPYCDGPFSLALSARRIYGIFAFRSKYLRAFTRHPETRLERLESCDSNRILDMPFAQHIAPYPWIESFSVDRADDVSLVESRMRNDEYWAKYESGA